MTNPLPLAFRIGAAAAAVAAQFFVVMPVHAAHIDISELQEWQRDNAWLRQSNGGFASDYPYDAGLFYYTLPSRSRSFALHSYTRNNYYKYYHTLPPPQGYKPQMTPQEAHDCGNYSFMRPNNVPPYGYKCN
ncbi:MAG: hypothetical protein PHE68_01345 [Candidatus Peribacteraceae bacterium]|nr:hypothetical protein [Candidatus Peribacteraceae bacterium]MDD5074567.1 hypothetical protein [Candidatus Peribacteraceae bacterium]